jgi:hypothetical protein
MLSFALSASVSTIAAVFLQRGDSERHHSRRSKPPTVRRGLPLGRSVTTLARQLPNACQRKSETELVWEQLKKKAAERSRLNKRATKPLIGAK